MRRERQKTILLVIAIIAVVALIAYLQEPLSRGNVERINTTVQKSGTLAPELAGIAGHINTDNITLSSLVGKKVVLVDIWTYSCINCQRTLPYITAWHERYKELGLEIIGVHTPEFEFEKDITNVQRAVNKWDIKYPVVLDNDRATWRAFQNQYWPRKYLIDIDGYIAYDHIGEGGYAETEREIQRLLAERSERLGLAETMPVKMTEVVAPSVEFEKIGTPELYLGYRFTRGNFGSPEGLDALETTNYAPVANKLPNNIYLEGTWYVDADNVRLVSPTGKVHLQFSAKSANIVAGGTGNITVIVDGKQIRNIAVNNQDLYELVNADDYRTQNLTFEVDGAGFELYTFTFG